MTGPTIAVILEKLKTIEENQSRMESKIDQLDCKIQALEKDNVKKDSMATTVDDHEKRIRELEKLAPVMRGVLWISGVLGVSVVALIWALITGTASIVFK